MKRDSSAGVDQIYRPSGLIKPMVMVAIFFYFVKLQVASGKAGGKLQGAKGKNDSR
jgi:hypothetical protein